MGLFSQIARSSIRLAKHLDGLATRVGGTVVPVVGQLAHRLDTTLESVGQSPQQETRDTFSQRAGQLNRRYQHWMAERVDPLFGRTRNQHAIEMGGYRVSPKQEMHNLQIAAAGGVLAVFGFGRLVAPITLRLTVPLSLLLELPLYVAAYKDLKQGKVTYPVVGAVSVSALWLSRLYLQATAATLIYFIGEKLLCIIEEEAHDGMISVFSKQPRTVSVLRDGIEEVRPLEEVAIGDRVVIRAGEYVAVDGIVERGFASIDQHMLTGEAQPVERVAGDPVLASTMVLTGEVVIRVEKAGVDTTAAKIGEMLNKTASYQVELQSKTGKLADDLALPVIAASGVALLARGFNSATAVLSADLGVSLRTSSSVAMLNLLNIAANSAILMKDGRSLELLKTVDTIVFDKTGTLTMTQPTVEKIHTFGTLKPDKILALAAGAERRQSHPIARAILAAAEDRGLKLPDIEDSHTDVGFGIKVVLEGRTLQIGSERYMTQEGIAIVPEALKIQRACHACGHSLVMVATDGVLAGSLELRPTIRPEAGEVIRQLQARGLNIAILSGDQSAPTKHLADALGVDRYFANVLPVAKADIITKLQQDGLSPCFVGDGINDAIALKRATVSVSLRGATTAATDAAQIVLMQESLQKLPFLFELADDMEQCMKLGTFVSVFPGLLAVGGVFVAGWAPTRVLMLSIASMAAGIGVALYPTYRDHVRAKHPDPPTSTEVRDAAFINIQTVPQ